MISIDWENASDQIKQSYSLTDTQVKKALCVLKHARLLYEFKESPECILLLDDHGFTLHKIKTRGGLPMHVSVQLPSVGKPSFIKQHKYKLLFGCGIIITGALICKYTKTKL